MSGDPQILNQQKLRLYIFENDYFIRLLVLLVHLLKGYIPTGIQLVGVFSRNVDD